MVFQEWEDDLVKAVRYMAIKIYGPKGYLILSGKEIRNILDLKSTLINK